MNRVRQPRPLVVLGLNAWMGTAAQADECAFVCVKRVVVVEGGTCSLPDGAHPGVESQDKQRAWLLNAVH